MTKIITETFNAGAYRFAEKTGKNQAESCLIFALIFKKDIPDMRYFFQR